MPKVFISYRHEDSSGYTLSLYERLVQNFGRENVFKDIDTIPYGEDFVEHITNAVGSCDVLVAFIGKHWLSAVDENGQRRLDDPEDFVRLEIQTALERDVRVIPCLVGDANLPKSEQLPASLSKLARRRAFEISDTRFNRDIECLMQAIDPSLKVDGENRTIEDAPSISWKKYYLLLLIGAFGLVGLIGLALMMISNRDSHEAQKSSMSTKTLEMMLDFQKTLNSDNKIMAVRNAIEACQPLYVSWGGKFNHEVMNRYLNFFENIGLLYREKVLSLEEIDFYFGAYIIEASAHPQIIRYIHDFQKNGQEGAFVEFEKLAKELRGNIQGRAELAESVIIGCNKVEGSSP